VLRRLDDNSVAHSEQRRELPGQQEKWRVPGGDRGDDVDRLSSRVREHPGPIDWKNCTLDLVGEAAKISIPFGNVADLRGHLRDELAVVPGLQSRKAV
jgi:hypothetical protein